MVGHRGPRYRRFGTASARLDDVANYLPARLFAALVAVVRPWSAADVVRTVRRDAAAHPSPNSGVAEAAAAACLGRQLGGPLRYGSRREERPFLGSGPRPAPADIARARRLTSHVELAVLALLGAATLPSGRRGERTSMTWRTR
jgi:adenosylcobinamide-phosphate synthase